MLSDQAIISGIRIGGLRESEAIQAIYDQFEYVLQKVADLKQENFDADIIRETVECFVNGVKNNIITSREEDVIGDYLKSIAQKIKNPEDAADDEIERLFDDKIVWDFYLSILNETETSRSRILTRSFGEGVLVDDLAARLVAKGDYPSIEGVKGAKANLLKIILGKL